MDLSCSSCRSQAAALPRGAWGMRAARGRAVGGPWEGRAGGSLAMAPTPSPKCHLPLAPDGGKPDFSVQGAGAAWSSTPCRVAPSGAGSTAHRGLGRTSPLSATVGWEATIAKCGGARSARSCVLYAARSSGLRRTSRTSARPHRRSPCRRSGGAGLCRRCGSGCGGAGCKGGGGVVAASRRDAHRSCTASSLPRRRCRTSWLRRPLAAAEPLRWPLGWRPSDGVAVRSESRITNVAPSRRPRCRGEGRSGA